MKTKPAFHFFPLILFCCVFCTTVLAQENKNFVDAEGYYIYPSFSMEVASYYSGSVQSGNDLGFIKGSFDDSFNVYGIEIGKFKERREYGIYLRIGDSHEVITFSDERKWITTFAGLGFIVRNSIFGTKPTNKFQVHFGGSFGGYFQYLWGNEDMRIGSDVVSQNFSDYNIGALAGLHLEVGTSNSKGEAFFLNLQPVGFRLSRLGVSYEIVKIGLLIQL